MDRHEGDGTNRHTFSSWESVRVRSLFIVPVLIGDEGDILEEGREVLGIEHPIIACSHIEELFDIFDLSLILIFGIFSLQVFEIVRPLDHRFHHFSDRSSL